MSAMRWRWRWMVVGSLAVVVAAELDDHPDGPVAQALTTPLMAWLARTAYSDTPADPGELLATDHGGNRLLGDRAAVEGRLLDRLVPAVYAHDAEEEPRHRWAGGDVHRWLTFLALHLDRLGTRDLAWWQVYRAVPRLVFGLVGGLGYGLALVVALTFGLVFGPVFGLAGGLMGGLARSPDLSRVQITFHGTARPFLWRSGVGLVCGLGVGLAFGLTGGLAFGLTWGEGWAASRSPDRLVPCSYGTSSARVSSLRRRMPSLW